MEERVAEASCGFECSVIAPSTMRRSSIWAAMFVVSVAALVLLCPPAHAEATSCLQYQPTEVTFSGTLLSKTFGGTSDFPRKETYWVVQLDPPVCVDPGNEDTELEPAHKNVNAIQVVIDREESETKAELVGKRVTAVGTLFSAITAHHHTPVVMMVKKLEAAKPEGNPPKR